MKLCLAFAILGCLVFSEVHAQQRADLKEPSQMSKYDFLALTSKSDSLTAVVNMFFRKRKSATTTGLIIGGSSLLIGGLVASANATEQLIVGTVTVITTGQYPDETKDPGGEIALVGLATGTAIVAVGRSKYTKNNLYKIISEYQETKKIPSKYASKLLPKDFSFMTY